MSEIQSSVESERVGPSQPLPAGAWDCHAHVFGPFAVYPLVPDIRYQPPLAPADRHLQMLNDAGLEHGVLVHAAATGFDNRSTIDAVALHPTRLRAVAVVSEDAPDREWEALVSKGVRAIRFTETGPLIGAPKPAGTLGLDALRRLAPRLKELGLHANVWARCEHVVDARDWLEACGVTLVFDHMGQFDVTRGADDRIFQSFVAMLKHAPAWVKLVTLRVSRQDWRNPEDIRPYHDELVAQVPDQLLWGSDWPFISMDKDPPMVGRSLDILREWVGSEALLRRVLCDNPRTLYD